MPIKSLSSASPTPLSTWTTTPAQTARASTAGSLHGKMPDALPSNRSVNESYARPASPIGTTVRASTRYLSTPALQGALDKLPTYTSVASMTADAAEHLKAELAKCDPSKPTVILIGDLHGTAGDLGTAVTALALAAGISRPMLLVEQPKSFVGAFDIAYSLGDKFRKQLQKGGATDNSAVQDVMSKHGFSQTYAIDVCTWATAYALRGQVEAFDIDKERSDATMEVREEPMKRIQRESSQRPGTSTVSQAGIFHLRALHEELLNRSDAPNVIALAVVPEKLEFLQPEFKEQDIRRLSYLMATNSILKLRQADSMINDFPDCVALMRQHSAS